MSDDYMNFISAQSSTLKQKLASSIPYYSNLHFRPIWFLSINFSIFLNNLFGAAKDNFILFRIENLLLLYIIVFLTAYLFLTISKRPVLSYALVLLCILYPNNINDICWTIGKVDLLCGIFMLSSLIFTFSYLGKKSLFSLALALVFFILALFTKETSVILPFITMAVVYISLGRDMTGKLKYMIAIEFMILLMYTLVRIYVIGIYPGEVVTAFQTPGIFSSLSVTFKAFIALIFPYDYLSLQNNLSGLKIIFIIYILLIITFLVTTIFILVRTNNLKNLFYLALIFMISIAPNLIAGYFRPQLILIPYLIFYLSLFIIISKISVSLKFYKIILPFLLLIYLMLNFNLIKSWQYAYQNSRVTIKSLIDLNLDNNRKNIILGLPSRLNQTHMLEYSTGPYNYWKFGEFQLHEKIYDLIHTGALDTGSLRSEISIKEIGDKEYELESSGDSQYFLKLDGNMSKYKDQDVIIKLSGKNSFRKFSKMYIKILSDKANVYVLNGKNFIKLY
ncbi:MAG: hypothetical protein ABI840_03440 [bacterium]